MIVANHPAPRALLFLDVESTGLDPHIEHLLEITAVLTSFQHPYTETRRRSLLVFGPGSHRLLAGECDPFIQDMHERSGLTAALRSVVEPLETTHANVMLRYVLEDEERRPVTGRIEFAEKVLLDLVDSVGPIEDKDERVVLAGSTVAFDQGFLRVHMPELTKRLSYRTFDVSALRMFAQGLGWQAPPRGEIAHRTSADVDYSLSLAREIGRWVQAGVRP